VELVVSKPEASPGPPVLELEDRTVRDDRGLTVVDHVSLTVRAGEVVALAGVQGNGQTELAEAVTCLRQVTGGSVRLKGLDLTNATPRRALRAGIAHIPEDRQVDGLVLSMSIADNLVLDVYNQEPNAHFGARDLTAVRTDGERKLREFDIPSGHAAGGRPAHPGPRRRLDRVRPPPDNRRARPRGGRPARLLRTG
jgi:simple sugar transport system ATP-binding protein